MARTGDQDTDTDTEPVGPEDDGEDEPTTTGESSVNLTWPRADTPST